MGRNITDDFRGIVKQRYEQLPESTKRKRENGPFHSHRDVRQPKDEWMREAYRLTSSISSLEKFLASIRKAYLSNTSGSSYSISSNIPTSLSKDADPSIDLAAWANIKTMTERDRDAVDFEARVIIKQCLEYVKQMEEVEKVRQAQVARSNPIASFFRSSAIIDESELLAAHRAGVTWLLNQRLTHVSHMQKDQQETRLMRQLEKSQSMLDKAPMMNNTRASAAANAAARERKVRLEQEAQLELQSRKAADGTDEPLPHELVQMLEKENETMLKEMETTMNQVKNAEKALLEISELQSELSSYLAVQTHQTDRLHAEAVEATDRIGEGNVYLVKARNSNSTTRKYILVFLLTSSFVLLFLDWYN